MEYSKLEVWIEARKLVNLLYDSSKLFPKEELFGLTNQMRRAAVSIPSNIAEGCGRQTSKDTINFLHILRGSLYELETQLYISKDLSYITEDQLTTCLNKIENLGKLLNGFIRYNTEKKEI